MSLDSATTDPQHWSVECSDDESYFDPAVSYRISPKGSRIWEPSGDSIVRLYEEIEATGFNNLEWQCPGRISPSQLHQDATDGQYAELEDSDSLTGGNEAKSKFDFDNEFDDDTFSSARVATKRTQAGKKSQTNLSKVMLDIKKYQMIDQKGTKSKPITAITTSNASQSAKPSSATNSSSNVS